MRSSFRIGPGETVQHSDARGQLVFARGSHQRDDFGVGIENNKSRGLDVKDRRRAVGDRDHIDLAPLMRHPGVDQGFEKIEAERVGLIDLLLRAATGANESPAGELIALLHKAKVLSAALAARNFLDRAAAVHRVAIGRKPLDAAGPMRIDDIKLAPAGIVCWVACVARCR